MNTAEPPFQFSTASYLKRVGFHKSLNARGLNDGLEKCSDASIFCNAFQGLDRNQFLPKTIPIISPNGFLLRAISQAWPMTCRAEHGGLPYHQ